MNNSYCEICQSYIDLDDEPEHEKMCKEKREGERRESKNDKNNH